MHRKRGLRPCQGCWGIAVTGIACMSNTVIPGISRIRERPSIGAFTLFPVRSDCPLARYTTRPGVRSGISGGGVRICPQQVAWNRSKLMETSLQKYLYRCIICGIWKLDVISYEKLIIAFWIILVFLDIDIIKDIRYLKVIHQCSVGCGIGVVIVKIFI